MSTEWYVLAKSAEQVHTEIKVLIYFPTVAAAREFAHNCKVGEEYRVFRVLAVDVGLACGERPITSPLKEDGLVANKEAGGTVGGVE